MDFSKMKLVSEMLAGGAGTGLSVSANNKASQQAQAPKAMTNTSNNIGMQQNQMAQKQGNVKAATVQKTGGAPAKQATTGNMAVENYFEILQKRKEYIKNLDESKSNWKKDLTEALGVDDEVFHPYVEVMPFKDFKQNEAKKNLAGQAMKAGAAENPAQKTVKAGMMGMGEEVVQERAFVQPEGAERKKREKAEKERKAQAAKDAVRHMRVTKGIPGYDEKGKYHLKNGKKEYENAD